MFSFDEKELITRYLYNKIKAFKKAKSEIQMLKPDDVFEIMKDDEVYDIFGKRLNKKTRCKKTPMQRALEIRLSIITSYTTGITQYYNLIAKIKEDKKLNENEILELHCLITNKENFDKIHNLLHISIIKKIEQSQTYKNMLLKYERNEKKI